MQPIGEKWDYSSQSKEQIQAILLNRQIAAMRREKALAYALTQFHQAKDQDGWVEYKGSLVFERPKKIYSSWQIIFSTSSHCFYSVSEL